MSAPELPERFNMADYFLDARVREGKGERTAIRVGERSWTYREVQEASDRCSHALRDRGVRTEDRVLIVLYDGFEFAASFFGLLKAGGVFCMTNPLLLEADYEYLLEYTRARAVIADARTLAALGPALDRHPECSARLLVGDGDGAHGFEPFDAALAAASNETDNADTHKDDVGLALYERHDGQVQGRGALSPRLPVEHRALRQAGARAP